MVATHSRGFLQSDSDTDLPSFASIQRPKSYRRRWAILAIVVALVGLVGLSTLSSSDSPVNSAFSAAHSKLQDLAHASIGAGEKDGLEDYLGPKRKTKVDGFTIVTPTYKREKDLPLFLSHYANGAVPSLKHLILIWVDREHPAPQWLVDSLPKYKVPVTIRVPETRSLNERFRPDPTIATDAVLAIDDDILLQPSHVEQGFEAWKTWGEGRQRMVGFMEREVTDKMEYTWDPQPTYSMVLTKVAFLHIDWHKAYWSDRVSELRAFVDERFNGEDILMSFLHARYTRKSPLFFNAHFQDLGLAKGISSGPDHLNSRTACVRKFSEVLGNDTLVKTSIQLQPRPGSEKLYKQSS